MTFHPVAAVLGGDSLFTSDTQTEASEQVTLSSALQSDVDVCFMVMSSASEDNLQVSCRAVCTELQVCSATFGKRRCKHLGHAAHLWVCTWCALQYVANSESSQVRQALKYGAMQDGEVSLSFHNTQYGDIPFLFIGPAVQRFAQCQEIEYPNTRTAAGWMCRGLPTPAANLIGSAPPAPVVGQEATAVPVAAALGGLCAVVLVGALL